MLRTASIITKANQICQVIETSRWSSVVGGRSLSFALGRGGLPSVLATGSLEARSQKLLHQFCSPQIVQVNNTFQFAARVHHRKRSDFALFHDRECSRRKLLSKNCLRIASHTLASGEIERVFPPAFEQPPQIA